MCRSTYMYIFVGIILCTGMIYLDLTCSILTCFVMYLSHLLYHIYDCCVIDDSFSFVSDYHAPFTSGLFSISPLGPDSYK